MSKFAEYIKTDDFKKEKHVPAIEIPAGIKANEAFEVKVSVGRDIAHPNTTEHFIEWIELYYKPEGENFVIQIGKASFSAHGASAAGANAGSAYTDPVATFKVKLAKPGVLTAVELCNIHGLWENSVEIKI